MGGRCRPASSINIQTPSPHYHYTISSLLTQAYPPPSSDSPIRGESCCQPFCSMARAASSAIAFSGMCVGISAAVLLCSLSQSPTGAFDGAAEAAAAQLDPAAYGMLAATATFFTAIYIIYVHLRTGGRGGAGGRRIPEVMFFILCASVGFLHLFCIQQPGPIQVPAVAVLLRVVAVQLLLPYAGAATFYLSLVLTYVHVRAAAGGGAVDELYPAAVEVLKTVTLAATLITGVLSSIAAAALVFNAK